MIQLSLQFEDGIYEGDNITILNSTAYCHNSKEYEWVLMMPAIVVKIFKGELYFVKIPEYNRIDGVFKGKENSVNIPDKTYTVTKILKHGF